MNEPWIVSFFAMQARLCGPPVSPHRTPRSIESCLALASNCTLGIESVRSRQQSSARSVDVQKLVLRERPSW